MKKLLIFGVTILLITGCKKTEIEPDTLSNTFWSGFFSYPTVKDASSRLVAEVPYGFELVEGGEYRHFDFATPPFQISRGRWQLKGDTLVITQTNKNVITFKYTNRKLFFLKMTGPPLPWIAFDIEKYEASSWQNLAGTRYNSIIFHSENSVSYGGFTPIMALERYNNLLWWSRGSMSAVIRKNGVLHHMIVNGVLPDGNTYISTYKNTKN